MSDPTNCTRCSKDLAEDGFHSTVYDKDHNPVEYLCWACSHNDTMASYRKTKEITSSLMMAASSCEFYATEARDGFKRLRECVADHYQRNLYDFLQIARDVKEIADKGREFELKHWLPTLQPYYRDTDKRGHSAVNEEVGYKALLWGSAGRVLLTVQDTKPQGEGKFGGAWVTLIFDETADYARGGIQGLCATKDEAMGLLQAAIDTLPEMKADEEVTLAGPLAFNRTKGVVMKHDKKLDEVFGSENVIDVWTVYQGDDDRHSGYPAWFFSTEDVAKAKAKGSGWYGGDAHVEKRKAVRINNKYYLIDSIGEIDLDFKKKEARKVLRDRAKAKLSQEELDAIGYKDKDDDEDSEE